ncbi:type II secretion system F family protein [Bacillaceae bacterium]
MRISFQRHKGWTDGQLADFSEQLAHLLAAGLPLLLSLDVMRGQMHPKIARKLAAISEALQNGQNLSRILHTLHFPSLYVSFIKSSEHHGNLIRALEYTATYYRNRQKWKQDLAEMLTYPLLVLFLVLASFGFLVFRVLPEYSRLYEEMGISLPFSSKMIFMLTFRLPVYLGLTAAALLLLVVLLWKRSFSQCALREWALCVPGLRTWLRLRFSHYFAYHTGYLLEGGITLLQACRLLQEIAPWKSLSLCFSRIERKILDGSTLSDAVREERCLLPVVLQVLRIAEQSGTLGKHLVALGEHLERERQRKMRALVKICEPLLIVCLGGMICFIVVTLFSPMFGLVRAL